MAVSGLPEADPDQAQNLARVAVRKRRDIERRNSAPAETWRCRIAISSGPIVGSILGVHLNHVFGPGESLGPPETPSEPFENAYLLIRDHLVWSERGHFEVTGFGQQNSTARNPQTGADFDYP